jgi:glyoxylase-like metal-dependent hydrolase (beta-lactamase superfamily II)
MDRERESEYEYPVTSDLQCVLHALHDGRFAIPESVLADWPDHPDVSRTQGIVTDIWAFALVWPDQTWLIDTGAGGFLPDCGGVARGIPDLPPVTRVLLTHLHPDHCGGLLDADGHPAFRGAEVWVSAQEHADWLSAPLAGDAMQVADWARAALAPYPVHLIAAPQPLGRGLQALPAPGHRAGHLAFRGEGWIAAGDIVHLAAQFAHPDRCLAWDADPPTARRTRHSLLGTAAAGGLRLALAHQGPGHVRACDGAFAFIPDRAAR